MIPISSLVEPSAGHTLPAQVSSAGWLPARILLVDFIPIGTCTVFKPSPAEGNGYLFSSQPTAAPPSFLAAQPAAQLSSSHNREVTLEYTAAHLSITASLFYFVDFPSCILVV